MKQEFFVSMNKYEGMEQLYTDRIHELEEALEEKILRIKELETILKKIESAAEELWDKIRRSI